MSLAEIEAELGKLTPDELRRLALKSWTTFVDKENASDAPSDCSEDDPHLLAALDEAIAKADTSPGQGHSGSMISRSPGSKSGTPLIAGTGVTVRTIVRWYKLGMSAEEIAAE